MMKLLTQCHEWHDLQSHQQSLANILLPNLFSHDPHRAERYTLMAAGLLCDFSKNYITQKTIDLLVRLAIARELPQRIEALFTGEIVNDSEGIPELHTALRALNRSPLYLDNQDIMPLICTALSRMKDLTQKIQQGKYLGYRGTPIRDIVNIGVGGSHLGPLLIYQALKSNRSSHLRCHFISNLEESAFSESLENINPETTLFIITSKSFTSAEALTNFHRAKRWMLSAAQNESAIQPHFLAVTAHTDRARQLGFIHENIFPLWSWVAGRFSIWSAVGLSAAIVLGWDCFYEFLAGADAMDQHFRQTELQENVPVLLALLSVWYINFFNFQCHAVISYSKKLENLPAYLQQLHMESQGKSCQRDGRALDYATGAVLFGGIGTDSQHSFHRCFFQGTSRVPIDFILPLANSETQLLQLEMIANCLGQSRALLQGYDPGRAPKNQEITGLSREPSHPHNYIFGSNPSTTLLMETINPRHLGALLALYEHKVYVQSTIWNINAFDQWGVEHGKNLTQGLLKYLETGESLDTLDGSTQALVRHVRQALNRRGVQNLEPTREQEKPPGR